MIKISHSDFLGLRDMILQVRETATQEAKAICDIMVAGLDEAKRRRQVEIGEDLADHPPAPTVADSARFKLFQTIQKIERDRTATARDMTDCLWEHKDLIVEALCYPTEDAFMRTCRALNWRTAQLRALGAEPVPISENAPHHPPEGTFVVKRRSPR